VGPTLRPEVRRGRTSSTAPGRRSLACRRDVPESRGTWRYLFRAIDQFGQVIDVFLSLRRNTEAARRFFDQAISRTRVSPTEVTTDRYGVYPPVLDELLPAAFHHTEVHANNPLETDHGRLKARLQPMRGLKRDRTARVILAGHAFVQNLRRGFYDLGTDVRPTARLADAFANSGRALPTLAA
jgi:transposase-like protein